ncbi:glycoside hydrolase [Thozetella sp. PMI_491]|nr:glycoside hydrolase [Thozetella sp. PMI_491]
MPKATGFWSGDNFRVDVTSDFVTFVQSESLKRLRPGDKTWIQVGVKNKVHVSPVTSCSASIIATWGSRLAQLHNSTTAIGLCGIGDYVATVDSLKLHESPDWFNDIKYGIFIHWDLQIESYSECKHTRQCHLDTYGSSFNYDEIISNFTVSKFDPKSWLDLIDNARAYTSKRSSVHYGVKRDFIGELLSAVKASYPHLRRGTYFSLPEWYNPAYAKYAKLPSFQEVRHCPPTNPYTNEEIDYTGFVPVEYFIIDMQLPQMEALAYNYGTEIMWCDIGGANNSTILLSAWLNWARYHGRQVAFNSRCGLKGDYDTPEYKPVGNAAARKWKATRGMDPHSFGYNYMAPDDQYLTGNDIVQSLVDIVSKNGNFLLDIGPRNDGAIPKIMQTNLLDRLTCLFNTHYWLKTPGTGNLRYTTTKNAFYIHIIVPYLNGDKVTVVGGKMAGHVVPMAENANHSYTLTIGAGIVSADKYFSKAVIRIFLSGVAKRYLLRKRGCNIRPGGVECRIQSRLRDLAKEDL